MLALPDCIQLVWAFIVEGPANCIKSAEGLLRDADPLLPVLCSASVDASSFSEPSNFAIPFLWETALIAQNVWGSAYHSTPCWEP